MNNNVTLSQNIIIPKPLIRHGGVVVLLLNEYERMKEDLEILQSKKLPKDIEKARKDKISIPLEKLLREYNL